MILPLVLVVLVVLSILGITVLSISLAENKESAYQENKMQAYYLARAGAEAVAKHIIDMPSDIINIKGKTSDITRIDNSDKGYFQVQVKEISSSELNIISTGTVGMHSEGVTLSLKKSSGSSISKLENALYVNSSIEFTGSTKIKGSVMTNFTDASQILFDNSGEQYITGDLLVLNSSMKKADINRWGTNYGYKIQGSLKLSDTSMPTFEMPVFPTYPLESGSLPGINNTLKLDWSNSPYTIINSGYYKGGIEVPPGEILNINVKDSDMIIRTKYLRVGGVIKINKTGIGKVYVYIDGTDQSDFQVSSGMINVDGNSNDLLIYFKTNIFDTNGNMIVNASIYGRQSNIHIGGSDKINGNIIAGGTSVKVDGDVSANVRVIYAPNAAVNLDGSGKIKGSIIAQSLKMTGGSLLEYASLVEDSSLDIIFGSSGSYKYDKWK